MGGADIVPGISGGTIALIVGIYERFIESIKSLNINFIYFFLLFFIKRDKVYWQKSKSMFFSINWGFLLPLGFGIGTAFAIGSKFVPYFMETYPLRTYSFFLGLILFSIEIPFKHIEEKKMKEWILILISSLIAFYIVGMPEMNSNNNNLFYLFFCGFIAITAMMLPGISGSYILLILGEYKNILMYLHKFLHSLPLITQLSIIEWIKISHFVHLIIFVIGLISGLVIFSRILSYLLKHWHSITMSILTGFLIGSLRKPISKIIDVYDGSNLIDIFVFFLLGIGIILGLRFFETQIISKRRRLNE